MTPGPGDRTGDARLLSVAVSDDIAEALGELPEWRAAGDSVDWDIALIAYDVPEDTVVTAVPIPAGLYTRQVTGGGYLVVAQRWNDRDALVDRLDDIEKRHTMFVHIAHAPARFVAAHQTAINAYADGVLALIERDERADGPLYDVSVRCWDDLARHVDEDGYLEQLSARHPIPTWDEDTFAIAVQDRTDTLLHERDRLLSFDEAQAAGLDGTLRDGSPPHTWAELTPRQRAVIDRLPRELRNERFS